MKFLALLPAACVATSQALKIEDAPDQVPDVFEEIFLERYEDYYVKQMVKKLDTNKSGKLSL